MFRLRLQVNGSSGGRPPIQPSTFTEDTTLPFDVGDDLGDLDIPDNIADPVPDTTRRSPDLARSHDSMRAMGATVGGESIVGTNPSPSDADVALQRACNRLNYAQTLITTARRETGMDMPRARGEIQTSLNDARAAIGEAVNPPGRAGVRQTHTVNTELHPNGVSVAQIQQRLRSLTTALAALPNNNLVAAAGVGVPPRDSGISGQEVSRTPSITAEPVARPTARSVDELMDQATGQTTASPAAPRATPNSAPTVRPSATTSESAQPLGLQDTEFHQHYQTARNQFDAAQEPGSGTRRERLQQSLQHLDRAESSVRAALARLDTLDNPAGDNTEDLGNYRNSCQGQLSQITRMRSEYQQQLSYIAP